MFQLRIYTLRSPEALQRYATVALAVALAGIALAVLAILSGVRRMLTNEKEA